MRFLLRIFSLFLLTTSTTLAQKTPAETLFLRLRSKVLSVNDYTADVKMKIDVSFMRVPQLRGKLYFKSPDKLRLERNGGLSVLPKKNMSLSLNHLFPTGGETVIDAGTDVINGHPVRILKVVPNDDASDIVLTKLWVDEARLLALRTESTTRDNGTVKTEMEYGRYEKQALPDRITFFIDVKEYKVPKGVTMDYDPGEKAVSKDTKNNLPKKGRIQIDYLSYQINTGLSDAVFAEKAK